MKIDTLVPPREFLVGQDAPVHIRHCANMQLAPDELVTFTTDSGGQHDVVRKSWGFYATGSLNSRLPAHNLRPLLVRNPSGQCYVLLVETGREQDLQAYLDAQHMTIVLWLDGSQPLDQIRLGSAP